MIILKGQIERFAIIPSTDSSTYANKLQKFSY